MDCAFKKLVKRVTFKGKNYAVKSVKPVDSFLFSKALANGEKQSVIYKISLPESENGKLDLDAFLVK